MLLPDSFAFTQQNLQDFSDCKRRFYLRHVVNLEWPAIESEPVRQQEDLIQLGTRFHLMCQQALAGVPSDILTISIDNPELEMWWQNFLRLGFHTKPGDFTVEKLLSIPFAGFRLAAKFDLLLKSPTGKITIYDWKTSQHQPKRQTLLERMQSRVYPLVAGYETDEEIEMVYWYPAFPDSPVRFVNTLQQRKIDEAFLDSLIVEISSLHENEFSLTNQERKCKFCRYRSLCDRGVTAGISSPTSESDFSDSTFDFDFESL
jgi:hypothetical protein